MTSGGMGMVKGFGTSSLGKLAGKLGYQMIGTLSSSIGNNWTNNKSLFSNLTLGVGPVNLTIDKGVKLRWQNNLGNIGTNFAGLTNLAFGGKARFDWENLAMVYKGGIKDKIDDNTAWGPYAVIANSKISLNTFMHEIHHIWQSRAMGDSFLFNYTLSGLYSIIMNQYTGGFIKNLIAPTNYIESQGYGHDWFK